MIEPQVDAIRMPENLRVGLMVSKSASSCAKDKCNDPFYGFAFGQSPFPVPDVLQKALSENAGKGKYAPAQGIPELREAIAGFLSRHFSIDADTERIFVGPGTKTLIKMIFDIVRGDVVVPSPSWIGYTPLITLLQKKFHIHHLLKETGYRFQL